MRWLDGVPDSMDMPLGKLRETVKDREAWRVAVHRVGDAIHHLILCPLLLLSSVFPSIRVFSSESVRIKWPKYWNFNFSISPSKEYSGLISFRMD